MRNLLFIFLFFTLSFVPIHAQTFDMELIWEAHGEVDGSIFGASVTGLGDINRDGYDDILIGSPGYYIPGRAYLYYGGNPMDTIPDLIFSNGIDMFDLTGYRVYGDFDLNGDSIKDFLLAGGNPDVLPIVFLFLNNSIIDTIPDIIFQTTSYHYFYWQDGSVIAGYDVNGDLFEDLLLQGMTENGRNNKVFLYFSDSDFDTIPDLIFNCRGTIWFGKSIDISGDFNGDGYNDILIGGKENGEIPNSLFIYYGGPDIDTIPDWTVTGTDPYWEKCSFVDDLNLDGYDDIFVSVGDAYSEIRGVFYYGGEEPDTISDMDFTWTGACYVLGELNGDEYNDYGFFVGGWPAVSINIFLFREDGIFRSPDFTSYTIHYDDYGPEIAPAGDVNGDGLGDVLLGLSDWGSHRGKVQIFAGDSFDVGIHGTDFNSNPISFNLIGNYPNPFNISTNIKINIPTNGDVGLIIYNIQGIEIYNKTYKFKNGGQKEIRINYTNEIPSGIYLYSIKFRNNTKYSKMIFFK